MKGFYNMNEVCYTIASGNAVTIITGLVTVASVLANLINPDSKLGKVANLVALNLKVKK